MRSPTLIQTVRVESVSFNLLEPFVTAAGQKSRTDNVQIRISLADGTPGVAEASSSIAMRSESQETMLRVLRELVPDLRGKDIAEVQSLIELCWRQKPFHPTAVAAMECALLDAFTRSKRKSLAGWFGGKSRTIESDLTLSVASPEKVLLSARQAVQRGFRRLKVKLSGQVAVDVLRMQAVREAAPRAELIADGNQGFSLSGALELVRQLERRAIPIRFLEQPFHKHDVRSMKMFRQRCKVALFADESVMTASEALKLFESNAADGVMVKVAKSGLLGSLEIIKTAKRYKKRLAIGCMEESKLGLAASVHLACGTGAFEWADLDSVFLLESSTLRGGFKTRGPVLSVAGIRSGTGI